LAGIGFTMSLFVTSLAFTDEVFITQAKIGILAASVIAGILGYIVLNTRQKG
jgi:NhaA family Na+:H+ antiporter